MAIIFFSTPSEFRKWLEENHKTETELIVGFYKVASKKPSMRWSESVDQALCYGWIDGIRKSIDDESYSIRFTPRRKNSVWSSINIKKVEELTKAGLMTKEGLLAFSFMKESSSKFYSHESKSFSLSSDFVKQFKKNKIAWTFFNQQAPSYQKATIRWVMSAKQEKTRQSRLDEIISESEKHKRLN